MYRPSFPSVSPAWEIAGFLSTCPECRWSELAHAIRAGIIAGRFGSAERRYSQRLRNLEPRFNQAVRIADRGYVIVHGQIAFEGRNVGELNNNELVRKFYLGL